MQKPLHARQVHQNPNLRTVKELREAHARHARFPPSPPVSGHGSLPCQECPSAFYTVVRVLWPKIVLLVPLRGLADLELDVLKPAKVEVRPSVCFFFSP